MLRITKAPFIIKVHESKIVFILFFEIIRSGCIKIKLTQNSKSQLIWYGKVYVVIRINSYLLYMLHDKKRVLNIQGNLQGNL